MSEQPIHSLDYERVQPDPTDPPRGWWYLRDVPELTCVEVFWRLVLLGMIAFPFVVWGGVLLFIGLAALGLLYGGE